MTPTTEIPRRNRVDQATPTEAAIRAAIAAVEADVADVRMTDAVILLGAALDSVADVVDGVQSRRAVVSASDEGAGVGYLRFETPNVSKMVLPEGATLKTFGGPDVGQPEYIPLTTVLLPDGRLVIQVKVEAPDLFKVVTGAPITLELWTGHQCPPMRARVGEPVDLR